MGSVNLVGVVGGGGRGEAELDDRIQDEIGGSRDGVAGEGQGLSEEDESRIAEDAVGRRGIWSVLVDSQGGLQKEVSQTPVPTLQQQPGPPGPVVCWERFLPLRSLKILLVENDDCTRQVVTALLRNCSYEVTATANGLEAWKILQDLTNHVDLVLTEVVMPCLSGIGLLCKIMSHKTCKNIPVIMMSSHDSMGIVFKCLSKGAVDFLVKPIRKNELRNLWQHVWRRCHSSSGSGSESGIQTQKSVKSKNVESDSNTGSSSEDDNANMGLNIGDGSDNGSRTQNSWTKCAAEVESPQPRSPSDQLADPHDSTCAQVIHPKAETFRNHAVPLAGSIDCQGKEILDKESMRKDLEIGIPTDVNIGLGFYPSDKVPYLSDKVLPAMAENLVEGLPEKDSIKNSKKQKDDHLELNSSKANTEPHNVVPGMVEIIANASNPQLLTKIIGASGDAPRTSISKAKAIDDAKELPFLELSLKRSITTRDEGFTTSEDRKTLRRSDLSAFSRYNTSAASNHAPTGCGGSHSFQPDNSLEGVKMESLHNLHSVSNAAALNQGSNGSSNNIDMGSTTKNSITVPGTLTEKLSMVLAGKGAHASAFHPVPHRISGTQETLKENIDNLTASTLVVQPNGVHHQVQVQHHHHHYHHHHVQSMQLHHQPQHPSDNNEFAVKITSSGAPQCGSSNVFSGPMECNVANYSINGSVSGSNHGSSAAANTRALNVESDSGIAGNGGSGGGNGSGSGSGVDENRFARREAALNKFRKKRKERCFEKKVLYQSRKRLAEQRPRIRGQFVRQVACEQKDEDAGC